MLDRHDSSVTLYTADARQVCCFHTFFAEPIAKTFLGGLLKIFAKKIVASANGHARKVYRFANEKCIGSFYYCTSFFHLLSFFLLLAHILRLLVHSSIA